MTTLNVDVLAIVCEFLIDVPDLLSVALTCSSLRSVAVGRLISSHTINLTTKDSIRKFHSFLFAGSYSRTLHVRAVNIHLDLRRPRYPSLIPDQLDGEYFLLVDILTSCSRLEHIQLFCGNLDSEGKLDDSHVVIDKIIAIPSLRSIWVNGSTTEALTVLREVRAPLQMVGLFFDYHGHYWHPAALENILNLTRLAPTLQNLELSFFKVDTEEVQPSIFDMAQYPAVRSLAIMSLVPEPRLGHLQHLFPGLDATLSLGKLDTSIPQESYPLIRATNLRAQRDAPSRAWKKLDTVRMDDAPMFYVLGLLCPIRLVSLEYPRNTKLQYARDALRENPVPQLRLSLIFRPKTRMLDDLLSPELAHTLSHLMVCLVCSSGISQGLHDEAEPDARLQWDDLLGEILSATQSLHKLTHLRIVVHADVSHGTLRDGSYSEGGFIDAIRGPVFDFDGTAAALARPLPSLQFLALTTSGYLTRPGSGESEQEVHDRWSVTQAWRISARRCPSVAQAGEPDLVRLHDQVAEVVMRKNELVFSPADKVYLRLRSD